MRRIFPIIILCLILCLPVSADNAAENYTAAGTVLSNGSCQITLNISIRLDTPVDSLMFPLGSDVSSVNLNGSSASLTQHNGITNVKLHSMKGVSGTFPILINYTVNNIVEVDESGKQFISVPLVSGFKYPIESMTFSVTMPDAFDTVPSFFSGYHEQDIERDISSEISGATISGTVNVPLKDSETLTLKLAAPEGMFPVNHIQGGSLIFDQIAMGIFAALAILYWSFTMRSFPLLSPRRSTPPVGLSAGNVGSYLVHSHADLTMMAVHWAQLGYLIIHMDENGRVLLYRKMPMGNERNSFEQRIFKSLFAKGNTIDATSFRYTKLCEKAALISRHYAAGYLPSSGNPKLFRALATIGSLFCGIAMGDSLVTSPAWQILFIIFSGGCAVLTSWTIQSAMYCLFLREKRPLFLAAGCAVLIFLIGSLSASTPYSFGLICWSCLVGLAAAYSGKRTQNGMHMQQDILGLRRYMRTVQKSELLRILRMNPDYYYELAPFALALGTDRQLAKRFDTLRIPECTWLLSGIGPARTADEFYPVLREAVKAMTADQRRPIWEKLLAIK